MSFTQYSQKHCDVVTSGIESISSFYESQSDAGKRSLLFCLDRYLDPYFKYNLAYEDAIYNWLEIEFGKTSNMEIRDDIFDLLDSYSNITIQGYKKDDDGNLVAFS